MKKGAIEQLVATKFGNALCACSASHYIVCAKHQPIVDFACSLVSQVYEETAQRLERRADYVESHMPNHNMAVQELREMSTSSRALKDSLSPEVVSA